MDYSVTGGNDDGIGAVDHVVIRSGYAVQSYDINLTTGTTSRSASLVLAPTSVDTNKTIDISVAIADRWGNPLGDHTLNMTATAGTVLSATHETDAYGESYGFPLARAFDRWRTDDIHHRHRSSWRRSRAEHQHYG